MKNSRKMPGLGDTASAEQKRAEETLRQHNAYLAALHETSLDLINHLDLTDLLTSIVTRATRLVDTPNGYLYLINPAGTHFEVRVATGIYAGYLGSQLKLGEGLAGQVWQTGQPMRVDDYARWPQRADLYAHSDFHAIAAAPLKSGDQVVGVIGVGQVDPGVCFGDADLEILSRFAELASIALDNAKLYQAVQQDIAERKQAEAHLQTIFENAPEAIVVVDCAAGLFTEFNENAVKLYGLSREELAKAGPANVSPPVQPDGRPSTEKALEKLNAALQGETPVFEWTHRNARGEDIPCEIRLVRLPGALPLVRASVTDITERKQAEAMAKESQARFQGLVETLSDWIWEVDQNGVYTYVSPRVKDLLGYEPEELLGKTPFDLMPPEEARRVAGVFGPLLSTQQPLVAMENTNRHKDGHLVVFETNGMPFFDADGNFKGYQGADHDITRRKLAERVIRESEDRFRRFTEATVEGLVFHEQGRIVDTNPATLVMFGLSEAAELIGKNLAEFVAPEFHELILKKMQLEDVSPYEIQCFRKDGSAFPVETSTRAYKVDDRTIRATSIRDITERKQVEEAVQASQRQLADIVASLPDATLGIDKEKRIIIWNRAIEEMTGVPAAEMMGKGGYVYAVPFYGEARPALMDLVFEDQATLAARYPTITRDGDTLTAEVFCNALYGNKGAWVFAKAAPLHDQSGNVVGAIEIIRDITARKQAEEELQKLAAVVQNSSELVNVVTLEGRMLFLNEAGSRMLGIDPAEVGQHTIMEVVPEPWQGVVQTELLPTLMEKGRWEGDLQYRNLQTDVLTDVHALTFMIRDTKTGAPLYLANISLDITESKRAEVERSQLASILESTTDLVAISDMEARIIYMNRAGRRAVGAGDEEDLSATRISDYTPHWALETVLNKSLPIAIQEGSWSGESAMLARDGHEFPVSQVIMVQRAADGTPQNLSTIARDITEQKRAETELNRQVSILNNSQDYIAAVDMQGFHIYMNPAGARMLGYDDPREVIGKRIKDAHSPEDTLRVEQEGIPTAMREGTWRAENRLLRLDGTSIPVDQSIFVIRDAQGQPQAIATIMVDITARQQAEESIRKNEAHLKEAEEVGNVGSWDYDMTTDTLTWSDHTYRIYGLDPAAFEVTFSGVVAHYPPGDREAVLAAFQKSIQDRTELAIEHRIVTGNDETRFVFERGRVTYSEDGAPLRMIGSVADITERKRVETEVQKNQQLLQGFLNNFPDGAFAKDLEGRFLIINRYAAEDIYGTTADKIIGKTVYDTFPQEVADPLWESEKHLLETGETLAVEEDVPQADGQVHRKITTKFPLYDAAGKISGLGGVLIDITDRKRLEAQVQEALERRGYQVQISTEISQEIATASELSDLFGRVVTLTKERLGYYHTQLLRYDPTQDAVVLINGYGDTGHKMLAEGHALPMGAGLIGTAAASGQTVMRPTLAEDPDWQPNPLLPDTQGEIAVPIKFQDKVLGVLDVQSNRAGALTEDDRLLLEGLCGQVAAAIEQTRLRQEMAERLEEVNRLYRSMSREGWKTYRETTDLPTGFMFDQTGIRPVDETGLADELFANIPMKVLGGEVVGTLTVADDPRHPTSPEDYAFLQQVSDQIALALESARLFEQTQSALAQTEKLSEAGLRFSRATDLQELLVAVSEMLGISSTNRALLGVFNYSSTGDLEGMDIVANWWSGSGHEPSEIGRHYSMEALNIMPLFISNATVFYNDTFHDERVTGATLELFTRQNIHSLAVLPLYLGSRQIGVLFLEGEEPHIFTPEETQLFSAIGPQVATVLENRRQFEQVQSARAQTEKLAEASLRFARSADLQELLQIAIEILDIAAINRAVMGILEYDSAGDLDNMTLVANWWSGHGQKPTGIGARYSSKVAKTLPLLLSPVPVFFNDVFTDDRLDEMSVAFLKQINVRAIAILPLYTGARQIGAIFLYSEGVYNFTQNNTSLFIAMGPQIATVLENRRQFERAKQQAEREATLNLISQKIQSATTVEAVLQIAARELGHALGAPMTIAQLSMKDKK